MSVSVAAECLNSCSGCEISILNMGEALPDLLPDLDFVHFPVLMDHKYFGQCGEKSRIEIPEAAVGIVSGGVRNAEHLEVAQEMRKKCRVLIALGTCATHGGIPSLLNRFDNKDLFECCYGSAAAPNEVVPPMLDRCYALDEKVKADVYLPGCPPHSDYIAAVLRALLKGEQPSLPTKSVCDACPTKREGKGAVKEVRRFVQNAEFQSGEPLSEMRCLLEQGLVCMGPVTRAGCAGVRGGAPRCIVARVPCRGCHGPVRHGGNQLIDMLNALASNGVDFNKMEDRFSLLRFSGAHGRLRPKRKP